MNGVYLHRMLHSVDVLYLNGQLLKNQIKSMMK